jgi:hypothetical protein
VEAKWLAEHVDEAKPLRRALRAIYNRLDRVIEDDPPREERERVAGRAKRRMLRWLKKYPRTNEKIVVQKRLPPDPDSEGLLKLPPTVLAEVWSFPIDFDDAVGETHDAA